MKTSFISENTDQELSIQELAVATGGIAHTSPVMKEIGREIGKGLKNVGERFWKQLQDHYAKKGPLY